MPHERRRHVRKRVDLTATLTVDDSGESFDVQVADMSVGGAYLETELTQPFGTKVTLAVDFPEGVISLPGTKRWDKPGGMGIQFGLLGVQQTFAVTQHLAEMDPSPDSRAL
jgi:PilZ domain